MALSCLCEWANHARLARRHASSGAHLIASLGIYIILVQVIAMIWGNDTKTLRTGLDSTTRLGGVIVVGAQWITLWTATGLLGAFALFLARSNLGLRLRALADNPTMFALFGYNVDRHRLLAFALSGFFAAGASLATAYDLGFDPHTGLHAVLLAIVAVIIGGQGSFFGPVLGALLLGLLRAQVVWHWSARWQEAATFGALAIFLLLRPQGLLGRQSRIEAAP
jgi:branched-chain amino acid transport system permease protein